MRLVTTTDMMDAGRFGGSPPGIVKIRVPFWVPIMIRHLLFRVPQKGTIILTTTHVVKSRKWGSWISRAPSPKGGAPFVWRNLKLLAASTKGQSELLNPKP